MIKWVFDVEATGAQRNKAHPFDHRNVACNIGFKNLETEEVKIWKLQYDEEPYGMALQEIQQLLNACDLLVGFNIKYDLHWLSRYRLVLPDNIRVFDCQLAWFILTNQTSPYPSLDGVSAYCGCEPKLDVVKTEYWDKGLDTNQVPYDILEKYLIQDLHTTGQVYFSLCSKIQEQSYKFQKLIILNMQDLLVLQDMEVNGLLLNLEKSVEKGNRLVEEIDEIDNWLREVFDAPWFNPNSGDHLSVLLYGGTLIFTEREDYVFTYKDGHTAIKNRKVEVPKKFTGLFKPLEKTGLAKEGFYATNEGVLVKLYEKAMGQPANILEVILHRAKLEKKRSTYYHGYPKKLEEFGWDDDVIHSNFNQCVTRSGRTSSTKPNVQNIEGEVKEVFITRFK
jgi:DNA polymerase I-like protein with 3'-5' exonuclease and polymerase domains